MVCQNPRRKPGRPEVRGPKGDSAYEVWVKAQPPGSDVSLTAYFKAITGLSAYQDWVTRQPAGTDTSFDAFMAAHKGQSAYQVWACYQPPGADTSLEAFLEYMKGTKGDDGQSFYEWWVSKQPEGADTSDAAFMEAMRGEPGADGKSVTVAKATTTPIDGGTRVTITFQIDGELAQETTFDVINGKPGEPGEDGVGIASIDLVPVDVSPSR